MGEAADLILDGYVNHMGEYTGHNNHNYSDNGFKPQKEIIKVRTLILVYKKMKWTSIYKLILQYGDENFGFDLANPKYTCTQICKHICGGKDKTNWNLFKKWLKTKLNEKNH